MAAAVAKAGLHGGQRASTSAAKGSAPRSRCECPMRRGRLRSRLAAWSERHGTPVPPADEPRLARLAALDSARPLHGPALVAEADSPAARGASARLRSRHRRPLRADGRARRAARPAPRAARSGPGRPRDTRPPRLPPARADLARARLARQLTPEENQWTPTSTTSPSSPTYGNSPAIGAWDHGPPMATRMTSARFVGRSGQLAELEAALQDAAERRPSLALIAGESGVGKSRLVQELPGPGARRRRARAGRRLRRSRRGRASLRAAHRRPPPPAARRPPRARRAARLRCAARSARCCRGWQRTRPAATPRRPACSRRCSPSSRTLAEERPVLLAIEDLHWADSSTRGFLSFLSRTPLRRASDARGRTYRSDELHRRHPLRPLLAELTRDPAVPAARPARLHARGAGRAARGHPRRRRPIPRCVERIWQRSEGNALFTEEILAAGLDGRGPLPPTLSDALMLRVEQLSPRRPGRASLARVPDDGRPRAAGRGQRPRGRRAAGRAARGHGRPHPRRERRGHLRLPPRPAARGGPRRPAARASARAPLGPRPGAREAHRRRRRRRAHHRRRRRTTGWPPATSPPRWRRRCAPPARPSAWTPTPRRTPCSSGRSAVGARGRPGGARRHQRARELLLRAADAADLSGEAGRFEALLRGALELVDPESEPRRAASVL